MEELELVDLKLGKNYITGRPCKALVGSPEDVMTKVVTNNKRPFVLYIFYNLNNRDKIKEISPWYISNWV